MRTPYATRTTPAKGGDDPNLAVGGFAGIGVSSTISNAKQPWDLARTLDTWSGSIALGGADFSIAYASKDGPDRIGTLTRGGRGGVGWGFFAQHSKQHYELVPGS